MKMPSIHRAELQSCTYSGQRIASRLYRPNTFAMRPALPPAAKQKSRQMPPSWFA